MKPKLDYQKELCNLKKLMEEGRIRLHESFAEDLRKVMARADGTIVEETLSTRIKALLSAIKMAKEQGNKEEFNKDLLEKMKFLSKEERERVFLSMPREKGAEYKEIYMAVIILEDLYIALSKLPKESFESEFVHGIIDLGGRPEDRLKDYIVLEIRKFYELASHEKRHKLPDAPQYWEKLKEMRDKWIAHPDKKLHFKTNEDVEKLFRAIDDIGLDKIVEEFKGYAKQCMNIVCSY